MIHQYKSNGYNIVMDVNSGSVHVVDDIVYDMIPLVEPLVTEGIKDADTIKAAVLNLAISPIPRKRSPKRWTRSWNWRRQDSCLLPIFMRITFLILRSARPYQGTVPAHCP